MPEIKQDNENNKSAKQSEWQKHSTNEMARHLQWFATNALHIYLYAAYFSMFDIIM